MFFPPLLHENIFLDPFINSPQSIRLVIFVDYNYYNYDLLYLLAAESSLRRRQRTATKPLHVVAVILAELLLDFVIVVIMATTRKTPSVAQTHRVIICYL